jgi:hypothetical protein
VTTSHGQPACGNRAARAVRPETSRAQRADQQNRLRQQSQPKPTPDTTTGDDPELPDD